MTRRGFILAVNWFGFGCSAPAFSIDDEDENELADDNLESIATLDSEFTSPTSLKKTAEDDI